MFKREHHIRVAAILQSLDADLLMSYSCFFGGGTSIVLTHNEYRESVDIDFVVSDLPGYRDLRQQVLSDRGINAITRTGMNLTAVREIRADQYGIRTMLRVGEEEIKFEIIHEGRVQLEKPNPNDRICGVVTLSTLDMATTKLLANSDRWADDSVHSRDLIDLAMLELSRETLDHALLKASGAYGGSIRRDLDRAIQRLRELPERLDECMEALKIDSVPRAVLWKKIRMINNSSR